AFGRLGVVLELLPQVTDGEARQQALLNASDLYKGVGQYDLSLSYSQQVIDANWSGRGACKGSEQKVLALYESGRLKTVGAELRSAIDECVRVAEPTYSNILRSKAAETYLTDKKVDEAIALLKQHYDEVKATRNPRLIAKWNSVLAEAYRKKGLPTLAQLFATYVTDAADKDEVTDGLLTAFLVLSQVAKERGDLSPRSTITSSSPPQIRPISLISAPVTWPSRRSITRTLPTSCRWMRSTSRTTCCSWN